MMYIPAKTFLLGEYAALAGESAIILTSKPCFSIEIIEEKKLINIHPDSPAGLFWQRFNLNHGLRFHDPYQGIGGLGASSAQFVGAVQAYCKLSGQLLDDDFLLDNYYQVAWPGQGIKPSGYDVLAQTRQGCVYINRNQQQVVEYSWDFNDVSLLLVHSGRKLATHHHLTGISELSGTLTLSNIVEKAKKAFADKSSSTLIDCINEYQHHLSQMNLSAPHTQALIKWIKKETSLLAIKGCGALGADIILMITENADFPRTIALLQQKGLNILANHQDISSFVKKS